MDRLFLDIETTIDHPHKDGLLVVGYALNKGETQVWRRGPEWENDFSLKLLPKDLAEPLADSAVVKVTQTKYDLRYLSLAAWTVAGDLHDTTVMAHVMNENTPLDIEWMAWKYVGIEMDKRLRRSGGRVVFRDDADEDHDLADWKLWWGTEAWTQFGDYCARDVDTLRALYWELWNRLAESEWLAPFLEERVPYTNTLLRMETRGLPLDVQATEALAEELKPEKNRLGQELLAEAGLPPSFNLGSGDQLAAYLFSRVLTLNDTLVYDTDTVACLKSCLDGEHEDCFGESEYPLGTYQQGTANHVVDLLPEGFVLDKLGRDRVHGHWTVKGRGLEPTPPTKNLVTGELGKRPSTSSPELLYKHAADPWVRKLCLEYRKLDKLLTTYLTKWPVEAHEGRLYGRFNQTGTVTGRLSSSGPNLQNVPARGERGKQVRGLFRATPGTVLVVGDYDQLEMRLMAHFSDDRAMTRIFREGLDPHLITAQGIFGQGIDPDGEERGIGKTLNFAMGYGAGPKKVAQVLSLAGYATTKDVAQGYLAEMARHYRGFFRWKQHVMETAKRRGNVGTIGGGRRRLRAAFRDTANWKLVGYGERQAVNAIIQGSAADIIRRAMVKADAQLPELRMLAQVHDELVFESSREGGPHVETLMELQHIAEVGHGFDLKVPLLFEPHVGESWASAKGGDGPDLLLLIEDDT